MMEFSTPDRLGTKLVVGSESGRTFALCHPMLDGPPDMQTSIFFQVAPDFSTALRIFDMQIVGAVVCNDVLYCVDNRQGMHLFDGEAWRDLNNPPLTPYRINSMKNVRNSVHGVADDGMIFIWQGDRWQALTDATPDLYLHDLVEWPGHGLIVSGENGLLATLSDGALRPLDVGTNIDLTNSLPLPTGHLLVTGWNATVLIVAPSQDEIRVMDTAGRDNDFLNAVLWQGRALVAAGTEILEYTKDRLETFSTEPATRLCVSGGRLWKQAITGVAVMEEGGNWNEVPLRVNL